MRGSAHRTPMSWDTDCGIMETASGCVKEMREEWFNNQRKQDQKALLLRELDKLSELL